MPNKEFVVRNGLIVGNTTATYLTANSSGLYGNGASITSVNAATVGGNTAATLRAYTDTKANTAYNDAVSYASSTATTTYNNAVNYAIAVSNTAYANAIIFSANASNLSNGTVPSARLSGSYTILASNATYATSAGSASSATTATTATNSSQLGGYAASAYARYATAADFTGRVTGRGQSSGDVGVIGYSGVSTSYNGYVGYSTYSFYGTGDAYISGQIFATSNITAYYSDKRLKTNITPISKPLELLSHINGVYFTENDLAKSFGYDNDEVQIGVLAQEVQKVVPNAVTLAPFDIEMIDGKATSKSGENYLTVKYEKLVPLLIEAVKELKNEVDELRSKLENK